MSYRYVRVFWNWYQDLTVYCQRLFQTIWPLEQILPLPWYEFKKLSGGNNRTLERLSQLYLHIIHFSWCVAQGQFWLLVILLQWYDVWYVMQLWYVVWCVCSIYLGTFICGTCKGTHTGQKSDLGTVWV